MTDSPRLSLKCGYCNDARLASLRADLSPLPGEPFGIRQEANGRWTAFPKGAGDEFTHQFECKPCRKAHKVSAANLASWWSEFAASGLRRDTRYLGRDR